MDARRCLMSHALEMGVTPVILAIRTGNFIPASAKDGL